MAQHVLRQIDQLKQKILSVAGVAEEAFIKAMRAVETCDPRLAREVIDGDITIDELEVDVEEECLKLLALYQPVAVDLRFIISTLKINNELERIGDLAVNIAERAIFLAGEKDLSTGFDFDAMAVETRRMLKRSLDALVNLDAAAAREVCSADDGVDAMNRTIYGQVKEGLRRDPEHVEAYIHYLAVSRHLERIADHATNIAEDVIYMVEGEIVRHHPEDYRAPPRGR